MSDLIPSVKNPLLLLVQLQGHYWANYNHPEIAKKYVDTFIRCVVFLKNKDNFCKSEK